MSEVFVIRNQLGHYWGKNRSWLNGSDPKNVLQVKHEDEGINTLFELSSKDVSLRGEVVAVALKEKGQPILEISETPLPTGDDEVDNGTDTIENNPSNAITESA